MNKELEKELSRIQLLVLRDYKNDILKGGGNIE